MSKAFKTLGEKLTAPAPKKPIKPLILLYILVVSAIAGSLIYMMTENAILGGVAALATAVFFNAILAPKRPPHKRHFLLDHDRQGFMRSLKLADKTAVFDGSNIYHFGLDNDVGVKALRNLIRSQSKGGARIICFFDANIYYTLLENAEFSKNQRFSITILEDLFDLRANEIYVVPSGVQADKYIIETVSQLQDAYAVTNDQFRDYADKYKFLTKNQLWRRGVTMNNGSMNMAAKKKHKKRRKTNA